MSRFRKEQPPREIRSAADVLVQYRAVASHRVDSNVGPTHFETWDHKHGVVADDGTLLVEPTYPSRDAATNALSEVN